MSIDAFFEYATKREQIRLDREAGWPQEDWTTDPIFKQYRFCNVHREDDKTTKWFRENIRDYLSNDIDAQGASFELNGRLLFATIAFRWFNKIETGEKIRDFLINGEWDEVKVTNKLQGQKPLITGAYMIKTPAGMSKLQGILHLLRNFQKKPGDSTSPAEYYGYLFQNNNSSLEVAHKILTQFPYLGDFMAYEVVTDLRHTPLLRDASDILTWANPGPGAARGLARVEGHPLDYYNRHAERDRAVMMEGMYVLLQESKRKWPWHSKRPWEMREVEHTLCEFDKYERVRLGEGRPKELFKTREN